MARRGRSSMIRSRSGCRPGAGSVLRRLSGTGHPDGGVEREDVRGAGDGELADLDAVTGEVAPLVEALRRAWDAEQEILADPARVELRQEVLEFEGLKARRDDARSKLDGGRVPRFERDALSHEVRQVEWLIHAHEASARRAAERLEADEEAAAEQWRTEAVLEGDKARGEIRDAAARRIVTAGFTGPFAREPERRAPAGDKEDCVCGTCPPGGVSEGCYLLRKEREKAARGPGTTGR